MTNFEEFLAEQMQDDEFRKEYEELEPHFVIVQAIINAYNAGMTKERLVAKMGISEKYISQLENANANPSVKTLKKLATDFTNSDFEKLKLTYSDLLKLAFKLTNFNTSSVQWICPQVRVKRILFWNIFLLLVNLKKISIKNSFSLLL